jgi:oligoendopeptidase F
VDEKNADRLMANSGDFRYHLETIRRFKPHTLSEPEEKIINIKNITGQSAVHQLYDVVTNGFTFTMRVGGKKKTMNREALTAYLRSPKAAVREAAYREMYRVYESQQDLLGEIYKTLVNDWKAENLQLRNFKTPLASRNLSNDIPDSAVEALLAVCMKNAPIFQRYFGLKAKLCKIKTMNRYHIYAPHRAEQKTYRYPDAVRMVLDAYYGFSPRLAELAQRVFADRHIDARTKLAGTNKLEILLFSLGTDSRTGRRETFGINVFKDREEMKRMADIFRGRIIDVTETTYVIELTGSSSKLDSFIAALDAGLILETVRTGVCGIGRGDRILKV